MRLFGTTIDTEHAFAHHDDLAEVEEESRSIALCVCAIMTNLDADMTLSAGERLGRYEILGSLGAGGMGEVYLAKDTDLDRDPKTGGMIRERVLSLLGLNDQGQPDSATSPP